MHDMRIRGSPQHVISAAAGFGIGQFRVNLVSLDLRSMCHGLYYTSDKSSPDRPICPVNCG